VTILTMNTVEQSLIEADDLEDDKFQCCPHGLTQDVSGCRCVWRLITLCLCLPLCYPCYLTKHVRQHHRKMSCTPRKVLRKTNKVGTLESQTSDSSPRQTLGSPFRTERDSQTVNVIFLKTETGFQMLNNFNMETVEKTAGVKGNSVVTVGNFTCDLAISQESCLSIKTPEEIHSNASVLVADIDYIVIVFNTTEELEEVVEKEKGIMGYVRKYWNGYFPLFLIQLSNQSEVGSIKKSLKEKLEERFSSCFRFTVENIETCQGYLFDAFVRFYLHEVRLQCTKLDKTYSDPDLTHNTSCTSTIDTQRWRCSGLCGLVSERQSKKKRRLNILSAARRKLFSSHRNSQNT